jgi:hypothetical protein
VDVARVTVRVPKKRAALNGKGSDWREEAGCTLISRK